MGSYLFIRVHAESLRLRAFSEQLKSVCVHSHSRGSHKLTQRGVISRATLRTPWRAEARALALALVRARPAAHEAILLEEHGIP